MCLRNRDYLYNVKNVIFSYDIKLSENLKYCSTLWNCENSYDCNFSVFSKKSYEWITTTGYNNMFSHNVTWCTKTIYSDNCFNSSDLFWCVWLKNKQYCILNKQYTKEEYNKLVPKIIEHMKKTWE